MATTSQRGYGHAHQQQRRLWQRLVDAGGVICWRCCQPIAPGTPWDLGHDDNDRSTYRGPEHIACNRATRSRDRRAIRASRDW